MMPSTNRRRARTTAATTAALTLLAAALPPVRLGWSAVVLDNRGEGHTGYTTSPCGHEKADAFLRYGSLPAHGGSCGPGRSG